MCAVIFVTSSRLPDRPWRWVMSMAVCQTLVLVTEMNSLSLRPLSLIAITVLSISQFVVGSWASALAIRKSGG